MRSTAWSYHSQFPRSSIFDFGKNIKIVYSIQKFQLLLGDWKARVSTGKVDCDLPWLRLPDRVASESHLWRKQVEGTYHFRTTIAGYSHVNDVSQHPLVTGGKEWDWEYNASDMSAERPMREGEPPDQQPFTTMLDRCFKNFIHCDCCFRNFIRNSSSSPGFFLNWEQILERIILLNS